MIAPGQPRLRRCGVPVRRGAFGVRKADGGRRSRRLSLSRTLVLAIMLPQSGDTLIGPVGLVPLQVVEPSPSVQLESRGVFFPLELVIVLQKMLMGVLEVVPPIQESGICFGFFSRAVQAGVSSALCPLMHVLVVLSHIPSLHPINANGAWHLLLLVRSFSGHPAGLGWLAGLLAVRSTRSIELVSVSSSPSYIVPARPLVAPPVLLHKADFRASPFWPTDWPSP